jgi:hypothetical protein
MAKYKERETENIVLEREEALESMEGKAMYMSNADIVADYRQAKTPMKQIAILADMNQCDRKEIIEILREAGCELPKQYQKKPKEAQPKEAAAETLEDVVKAVKEGLSDDDDTVKCSEALPIIIRSAAVEAIARLLKQSDEAREPNCDAVDFREQVRGVLAVVHEVERRCEEVEDETAL